MKTSIFHNCDNEIELFSEMSKAYRKILRKKCSELSAIFQRIVVLSGKQKLVETEAKLTSKHQ